MAGLIQKLVALHPWTGKTPSETSAVATVEENPDTPVRSLDTDARSIISQMLDDGRYALLLRPQLESELTEDVKHQALAILQKQMSIVPGGTVLIRPFRPAYDQSSDPNDDSFPVEIESMYLDRFPVTNRQFRLFVEAGGYNQTIYWDSSIRPSISQFVDRSGRPGPRFWKNGTHLPGEEHNPVVGVSWYEAAAFARWVGKRLPTDAEWVKAAAWPIISPLSVPVQRRFPWGELFDRRLANLWGSGAERVVAVTDYRGGENPSGARQLVGNVWEWTASNFGVWDEVQHDLELPTPMKSIRGGAYDTYFESQSTSDFQSGEQPSSRKHNIGFRCALGFADVLGADESESDDS